MEEHNQPIKFIGTEEIDTSEVISTSEAQEILQKSNLDVDDEKSRGKTSKARVGLTLATTGFGTKIGRQAGLYMGDDYGTGQLEGAVIGGLAFGGVTYGGIGLAKRGIKNSLENAKEKSEERRVARKLAKEAGEEIASSEFKDKLVGSISKVGEVGKNVGIGTASVVSQAIQGTPGFPILNSPIARRASAAQNMFKGAFINPNNEKLSLKNIKNLKLSNPVSGFKQAWSNTEGGALKKGAAGMRGSLYSGTNMLYGTSAFLGARDAYRTMADIKQGQRLPGLYSTTPAVPEYDDNSGATGDLVFALHRLRN